MRRWGASALVGLGALAGCGGDTRSADDVLLGDYLVTASQVLYGEDEDGLGSQGKDCQMLRSMGVVRDLAVRVWRTGPRYRVEFVGGCEVNLDLEDGVLVGDGEACDLDPKGALVAVGVTERVFDILRLDPTTGTFDSTCSTKRMVRDVTFTEEGAIPSEPYETIACSVRRGALRRADENGEAGANAGARALAFDGAAFRMAHPPEQDEACGAFYFRNHDAGGQVFEVEDRLYWESFDCTIDPTALPTTCVGGEIHGFRLPDVVVERFEVQSDLDVSGRIAGIDTERCFVIVESPEDFGAGGAGGASP